MHMPACALFTFAGYCGIFQRQQHVHSQPLLHHDLHSLLLPEPMLDGNQYLACKMLVVLMLSAQGMGVETH